MKRRGRVPRLIALTMSVGGSDRALAAWLGATLIAAAWAWGSRERAPRPGPSRVAFPSRPTVPVPPSPAGEGLVGVLAGDRFDRGRPVRDTASSLSIGSFGRLRSLTRAAAPAGSRLLAGMPAAGEAPEAEATPGRRVAPPPDAQAPARPKTGDAGAAIVRWRGEVDAGPRGILRDGLNSRPASNADGARLAVSPRFVPIRRAPRPTAARLRTGVLRPVSVFGSRQASARSEVPVETRIGVAGPYPGLGRAPGGTLTPLVRPADVASPADVATLAAGRSGGASPRAAPPAGDMEGCLPAGTDLERLRAWEGNAVGTVRVRNAHWGEQSYTVDRLILPEESAYRTMTLHGGGVSIAYDLKSPALWGDLCDGYSVSGYDTSGDTSALRSYTVRPTAPRKLCDFLAAAAGNPSRVYPAGRLWQMRLLLPPGASGVGFNAPHHGWGERLWGFTESDDLDALRHSIASIAVGMPGWGVGADTVLAGHLKLPGAAAAPRWLYLNIAVPATAQQQGIELGQLQFNFVVTGLEAFEAWRERCAR
ncbi:MAG: hypothetical protein HY553_12925 [Elusimicrobia bacterium]|nr:hypothetical protein [Elusimicrobiota bacterium]